MMPLSQFYRLVDFGIASVWIVMGLYCKILAQVPRHEAIVSLILGEGFAGKATILIGIGEVLLGIWIATGRSRKITALVQIVLVVVMNILELVLAAEYLLWGPMNMVFAVLFCLFIYINAFYFAPSLK